LKQLTNPAHPIFCQKKCSLDPQTMLMAYVSRLTPLTSRH
jgi:hypothetical protein